MWCQEGLINPGSVPLAKFGGERSPGPDPRGAVAGRCGPCGPAAATLLPTQLAMSHAPKHGEIAKAVREAVKAVGASPAAARAAAKEAAKAAADQERKGTRFESDAQ